MSDISLNMYLFEQFSYRSGYLIGLLKTSDGEAGLVERYPLPNNHCSKSVNQNCLEDHFWVVSS